MNNKFILGDENQLPLMEASDGEVQNFTSIIGTEKQLQGWRYEPTEMQMGESEKDIAAMDNAKQGTRRIHTPRSNTRIGGMAITILRW